MKQGLNFDPALATIIFDQAVIANPEPNATSFTLYVFHTQNRDLALCR
jgi:hypothetical protein